MNITYSEFVERLAKPGVDIIPTVASKASSARVLILALLMSAEIGRSAESFPWDHVTTDQSGVHAHQFHMLLGVVGEIGELVDCVKKEVIYNKPLDIKNLLEELGDLWFYITGLKLVQGYGYPVGISILENLFHQIRTEFGITLELIEATNMDKLMERYKKLVYSDAAAIAREDKNGAT